MQSPSNTGGSLEFSSVCTWYCLSPAVRTSLAQWLRKGPSVPRPTPVAGPGQPLPGRCGVKHQNPWLKLTGPGAWNCQENPFSGLQGIEGWESCRSWQPIEETHQGRGKPGQNDWKDKKQTSFWFCCERGRCECQSWMRQHKTAHHS